MSKVKVAVYGSLRKGFHNHPLIDNKSCEFEGFAKTKPEYTLFPISGFPGVKRNGNTSILVEVYDVDKNFLPNIDALEGYREDRLPNFYDRQEISVTMENGNEENVYIYEYVPSSSKPIIESGDWADYFKNRE